MQPSATRWAWQVLGCPDYPPPNGPADDPACWLCGGPTDGIGWPRHTAFSSTFTNWTLAKCPDSGAVCVPCAYLHTKPSWDAYVAAHPDAGLKTGKPMSWRSYSHLFAAPHFHTCPTRAGWRGWLLAPPAPPFLMAVAVSAQKHLLFRATVAHCRDYLPLLLEEDTVWLDRARFTACLADFEALYAAGFSKDSIITGDYHHTRLLKVGLRTWRALEEQWQPWRRHRDYARLAHHVARREESSVGGSPCSLVSILTTSPPQPARCSSTLFTGAVTASDTR